MKTLLRSSRCAILAVACAWTPLAAGGNNVFRCVDAGRVTYSDQDCGGERVVVAMAAPQSVGSPAPMRGGEFVAEASFSGVTLGMSPREVFQRLGRPVETRATLQGRTLVEYWFYRAADGRTSVAFQEGRVSGIRSY